MRALVCFTCRSVIFAVLLAPHSNGRHIMAWASFGMVTSGYTEPLRSVCTETNVNIIFERPHAELEAVFFSEIFVDSPCELNGHMRLLLLTRSSFVGVKAVGKDAN